MLKAGKWVLGDWDAPARPNIGEEGREARVNQPNYTAQKSGAVPDMGSA